MTDSRPVNILIVGVGGQGTILAGKVLSQVAVLSGRDVKFSEIHGMAQRGGSVVTQVRVGERVWSPTIDPGTADFMLAFEQLEALRWSHMMRPDGVIVMSITTIDPMPVITGAAEYPLGIPDRLSESAHVITIDAADYALQAGNPKSANVALLGRVARMMPFSRDLWEQALSETIPARHLAVNRKAFELGWNAL
ncbi:MAG: indolepyruvate oxidoreductase subunit beta [Armatimonadetes bacterium]|nr:indolepyruvate oxidoreductase subunit beta [Armatimonadota bacterium]HOC31221.1 indolepyruvate oxidoreductase subunit beta [Armatimonadota bacterium]